MTVVLLSKQKVKQTQSLRKDYGYKNLTTCLVLTSNLSKYFGKNCIFKVFLTLDLSKCFGEKNIFLQFFNFKRQKYNSN